MIWQELRIKVPREYVEPVSYLFNRYGRGLSMEEAGEDMVLIRSYLPNTSVRSRARIEVGVNLVRLIHPMGELERIDLVDSDWQNAWKSHFSLLRVGHRLVIKPSWIDYEPGPDEVVIELDPGMAFGTGYHPTTRMCLEALEELLQPGMTMLDLGTGSGILSIAAVMLGASDILALDIDPTAVRAARKNFKAGGFATKVRLAQGTVPHSQASAGRFDVALANISAKTIQERAQFIHETLAPNGTLVASGFTEPQREGLEGALSEAGFHLLKSFQFEDWVALLLSRTE